MKEGHRHTWPILTVGIAVGAVLASGGIARATTSDQARGCMHIYGAKKIIRTGSYCLVQDVSTSMMNGAVIEVLADDVVINLQGHSLVNTAGPETRAVGVFALNRKNVMVRNGVIDGFRYGVLLSGAAGRSAGHTVASLRVRNSRDAGIAVSGAWSLIWRNWVRSTVSTGPHAVGISQAGSQTHVVANTVVNTAAGGPGGYAAGIDLTHGFDLKATGNRVADVNGGDANYGIRCGAPFADENRVWRADTPYSDCVTAPPPSDPYPYPYPYPFSGEDDPYPY